VTDMTDPLHVSVVDPEVKPSAIVDNANDHTPDPATPPVVDETPDPPRSDKEGMSELREIAASFAATAATLTGAIAQLADNMLDSRKDASPASVPWTHRGGSHESDD